MNIVSYGFMQNAFIAGFLIALVLPFIGVIVINRRMNFLADSLGHINMSGITFSILVSSVLGTTLQMDQLVIIAWSILGAVLIEYLRTKFKEYKEVSIMIVYSLSIALTILFLNFSTGYSSSILNILFGNINSISRNEVIVVGIVVIFLLICFKFTYKKMILLSLEEEQIKFYGINYDFYRYFTIILITLAISIAIKVVGVLLVGSLLLIPILAASRFAKSLKQTIIYGIIITEASIIFGIIIAYILNVPTSSIIVLIALLIYLVSLLKCKE